MKILGSATKLWSLNKKLRVSNDNQGVCNEKLGVSNDNQGVCNEKLGVSNEK